MKNKEDISGLKIIYIIICWVCSFWFFISGFALIIQGSLLFGLFCTFSSLFVMPYTRNFFERKLGFKLNVLFIITIIIFSSTVLFYGISSLGLSETVESFKDLSPNAEGYLVENISRAEPPKIAVFNKAIECPTECTQSECAGMLYRKCEIYQNRCNVLNRGAKVLNQCGVMCLNDTNCQNGLICNSDNFCEEFKINGTVVVDGLSWKLVERGRSKALSDNPFFINSADGIYLHVYAEVTNNEKEARYVDTSTVKLKDKIGNIYESEYLLTSNSLGSFDKINPGITKKGYIYFDIPENAKIVNVVFERSSINMMNDISNSVKVTEVSMRS
jgi:hypothetical protein